MTGLTVRLRHPLSISASAALAIVATSASSLAAQAATPQSAAPAAKPPSAAQAAKPPSKAEAAAKLQSARERLQSADEQRFREGLDALTSIGGEAAAAAVIARVRSGLPPQLTEPAIDALVKLKRASAGPALLELTQHRRAQLRARALGALVELQIRDAQSAAVRALDDANEDVRKTAVQALTRIGNARALPSLLTAAERGVPGAWEACAKLVQAGTLKLLFARAQAVDVAGLRPALDLLLARKDLPNEAKLRTIAWVKEQASASARSWLVDQTAAPKTQPNLRTALVSATEAIDRDHPELKPSATAAAEAGVAPQPSASQTKPKTAHTDQVASAAEGSR